MTDIKKSKITAKPVDDGEKNEKINDDGVLDMVIAFDTTGSMGCYIESVKSHVRELIPELFKTNENLKIGIVAFGDYCDMNDKDDFGKAYQTLNLTRNENDVIDFINKAKNTSGGDGDEFYELVIKKIVEETEWRDNSKKSILFIADADPHNIGYTYKDYVVNNSIDWKEEAKKASDKGIQIDTLSLSYKGDKSWYRELSAMTNGIYAPFKSSEKTDELIRAAAWSRGGDATRELYATNIASYSDINSASYDAELACTYKAFASNQSSIVSDNVGSLSETFLTKDDIVDIVDDFDKTIKKM